MSHPLRMRPSASNMATSTGGAAATVTLAAPGSGKRWAITGIFWSYDSAPTGGKITLTIAGSVIIEFNVTAAGPGFIPFERPMDCTDNGAVSLVAAGGGGSVIGKCGFLGAWTENASYLG